MTVGVIQPPWEMEPQAHLHPIWPGPFAKQMSCPLCREAICNGTAAVSTSHGLAHAACTEIADRTATD